MADTITLKAYNILPRGFFRRKLESELLMIKCSSPGNRSRGCGRRKGRGVDCRSTNKVWRWGSSSMRRQLGQSPAYVIGGVSFLVIFLSVLDVACLLWIICDLGFHKLLDRLLSAVSFPQHSLHGLPTWISDSAEIVDKRDTPTGVEYYVHYLECEFHLWNWSFTWTNKPKACVDLSSDGFPWLICKSSGVLLLWFYHDLSTFD
jgi:hypothetical protein